MRITKTTEEIQIKINELSKSELDKDEALNIFCNWIMEDDDCAAPMAVRK